MKVSNEISGKFIFLFSHTMLKALYSEADGYVVSRKHQMHLRYNAARMAQLTPDRMLVWNGIFSVYGSGSNKQYNFTVVTSYAAFSLVFRLVI